jgi:hypothetical protein
VIVLGVDPGKHTGLCVLDMDADGTGRVLATESVDGDAAALEEARRFGSFVTHAGRAAPGVDLVAVETIGRVYPRPGSGSRMSTGLVGAARLGGEICGETRARGLRVVEVSAEAWRKARKQRTRASRRWCGCASPTGPRGATHTCATQQALRSTPPSRRD